MSPGTYRKTPLTSALRERSRFLALAGDETRIRILCFLFEYGEACVSDIAESVDASVNSVSHHLRLMKDNGLLESERMGTSICYKLVKSEFINNLKKAICA